MGEMNLGAKAVVPGAWGQQGKINFGQFKQKAAQQQPVVGPIAPAQGQWQQFPQAQLQAFGAQPVQPPAFGSFPGKGMNVYNNL